MWYKDLCEYYGVTPEEAIHLGTRCKERKPNLPSSSTCKAVSGKTFEELWDENPRETLQQKMNFYKDIGAWQVFRQSVYRKDLDYGRIFGLFLKDDSSILEYGCGIAPFTNWVVENMKYLDMQFNMVDVGGEHLNFAKWRLNRKAPDASFSFHEISSDMLLPKFSVMFDVVCIMDVLEHLPNPYDVVQNIINHSSSGSVLVETWVDKSHGKHGGPDLEDAEMQRCKTVDLISKNYNLIRKGVTRIHVKI